VILRLERPPAARTPVLEAAARAALALCLDPRAEPDGREPGSRRLWAPDRPPNLLGNTGSGNADRTRHSMRGDRIAVNSLQIAPDALSENRHVCAFFNGIDEQHRVLRSFIKDGIDQGHKAFHLVDPDRREEHLRRLADAGIDVDQALNAGQLEVHPWQAGPLRGDRFDQETWLAAFEQVLGSGSAAGYAQTRFLAQMEWALVDLPGVEDLIEFETRVNYVVPRYDGTVICAYDLSKFGASTVMYALRTHPVVIIGGLMQENPFYVAPDQLLREMREQRSHGVETPAR